MKKTMKLTLTRSTLTNLKAAGGPGHRTTNWFCTWNAWETCETECGPTCACGPSVYARCETDHCG